MKFIKYGDGYKYQLKETFMLETGVVPESPGGNEFVYLHQNGNLVLKSGYAWDGASGPAFDTSNFMRGSLVHDALYQLIRTGVLSMAHRAQVDLLLKQLVKEDGMWALRAWWVHTAVSIFGGTSVLMHEEIIRIAPKE